MYQYLTINICDCLCMYLGLSGYKFEKSIFPLKDNKKKSINELTSCWHQLPLGCLMRESFSYKRTQIPRGQSFLLLE